MALPIANGASIVIVGGGLSGTLCALHVKAARPDLNVQIIERSKRLGPGLAYGKCSDEHLLNVPVSRLDTRTSVSFSEWLAGHPEFHSPLADALAEAGGRLEDAFVQRYLFGAYLEEQAEALIASGQLTRKRGEAVAFLDASQRGVLLEDGRQISADAVILALGNLPPKSPADAEIGLEDLRGYVADPWARAALSTIQPRETVLLVGTGLTMVDIVLSLRAQGHIGSIIALSRRGLLPSRHAFGGQWPAFLANAVEVSPAGLLRLVRREIANAERAGIPWQRVIDAIRPFIARIWQSWRVSERRSFLRHLRPRWDVVRHRMAPRIADQIEALVGNGDLMIMAGRLQACEDAGEETSADILTRAGQHRTIRAARIINCTGPRSDFASNGIPLIVDARRKRLIQPDPLGLGIETDSCAVVSADGATSSWLFAVGPLTRPSWWEITAAPEINAQILDLATSFTEAKAPSSLADRFLDLGAGI